jgi:hypothetical protein
MFSTVEFLLHLLVRESTFMKWDFLENRFVDMLIAANRFVITWVQETEMVHVVLLPNILLVFALLFCCPQEVAFRNFGSKCCCAV